MTTFNNGFKDRLNIRGVNVLQSHPRKVLWVGNSDTLLAGEKTKSDSNNGSFLEPLSTLDYAIGLCSADCGDIIYIKPKHAETISGAAGVANDVAGVRVIGLGNGQDRPIYSFSATASTWTVSGANTEIENVILKSTIDSVVVAMPVTATGVKLDIESQDTSSTVEFVKVVTLSSAATKAKVKLQHLGFTAGDAMTICVDVAAADNARVDVNFYGKASTAVVNISTAVKDLQVTGYFYNESAALTKNVVDTATGSTWFVDGYDGKGGYAFRGGNGLTVASVITAATQTTALGTDGTTVTDSATTVLGAVGANNANNAFSSSSVASNADGSVLEREEYIQTDMLALPRCIASAAKTLTTGDVNIFTISGGPIEVVSLVGIVTTNVQGQATSTKVTLTTTSPAATVDVSAAAVDLTGIAAGTSISHINTTNILTPVTAGYVMRGSAFATNEPKLLVPAGTLQVNNASASNTGAITWYLRYVPLSPLSRVA